MSQPQTSNTLALWVLMLGNFIIGTGVLLPAGLLNDFTAEFAISPARAGLLLFIGGLVVGIGAPVFAGLTSRIERRHILTAALLLYAVGHGAAALAPSFELQMLLRAITVIGAAVFTPQAASTVGLLVPLEQRAGAIAFIFIGWSAASVAGIPLGALLAHAWGWRVVYAVMAALSALVALCVWRALRPQLFVSPLSAAAWKQTLTSPVLWVVFLVTLLSMSGQFTMFGYIAPLLRDGFSATPGMISLVFAVVGVAGVCGNMVASRVVANLGIDRVIGVALASLCIGFVGYSLAWGLFWPAVVASAFWGLGSFSSNSLQQSRLVAFAPHLAAATVALNTSAVYLGQSLGSVAGGRMIDLGRMIDTPKVALGFMACALALSVFAERLTRRKALAL
jgi:MFS transporter, DHA1 family, inner membrane transport protein